MAEIPSYPSNSNLSSSNQMTNTPQQNHPKISVNLKGNTSTSKRSMNTILRSIFNSQDVEEVKNYILLDVVIPKVKTALCTIAQDAVNAIFWGTDGRPPGQATSMNVSRVSYSQQSAPTRYTNYATTSTRASLSRSAPIFDDVVFEYRTDAEEVLNKLREAIRAFGVVSVNDAYDCCELSAPYTANNYGWTSLDTAYIDRNRQGKFVIRFPKAMPID